MKMKTFGAAVGIASVLTLPLAACSSSPPAVTTVTATPTTTLSLAPCPPVSDSSWNQCYAEHAQARQRDSEARQQQRQEAAALKSQHKQSKGGLPWWSWLLIIPAGLIGLGWIALKIAEANDAREISNANASVAKWDARLAELRSTRAAYAEDDDEDDHDEAISYPAITSTPVPEVLPYPETPSTPVAPAPSGSLMDRLGS